MSFDSDYTQRAMFYVKWKKTDEAQKLRPPIQYLFLHQHPNNFRAVREAFNLAWITHKMTT